VLSYVPTLGPCPCIADFLLHVLLQPLLEGKQTVVLPGSDTVIPVHPNFRFFAAQNDAAYGGRKQLPMSLRARFLQTQVPAFTHGELKAIVLKRFHPFLGVGTEDAIAGALAQVRSLELGAGLDEGALRLSCWRNVRSPIVCGARRCGEAPTLC
jgi:MoxR-like ATPase